MKGENFLLSIAIDQYESSLFTSLENAVFDATRFSKVLIDRYNFKVIQDPLINEKATRKKIIDSLSHLSSALQENDNIIIYHAGHGIIHPVTKKGYWIPYDGAKDSISNYISNSDMIDCIEAINARHIILISDSCFSGNMLTKSRAIQNEIFYRKVYEKKSRFVFASGRDEKVSDGQPGKGSPFANALIDFFKTNKSKQFSFSEMANHVKKVTGNNTSQQPIYGFINEFSFEGEMVFTLAEKENILNKGLQDAQDAWERNFNLFCEAEKTRPEWPFISKENLETKSLGIWCADQRRFKREGILRPDREQRLLNAGFIFDPQLEKFFKGLSKFLVFMEKEKGYNYVPARLREKYNTEEAWLRLQQKWYRKSPCDPTNSKSYPLYRYEALKRNGIQLIPPSTKQKWVDFQAEVIWYYSNNERFTSLPSQNDVNPRIAALGNRLNDYMDDWKKNNMSKDRRKFLEQYVDINYGKNKVIRGFKKQIQEYLDFKSLFPKSEPKQSGKYKNLANRLSRWKSMKRRNRLPQWQEEMLRKHNVPIFETSTGRLF